MAHPIFEGNTGRTVILDHKVTGITGSLLEKTEVYKDLRKFYEVIRFIDGIPLFVEDHLARLQASSSDDQVLDDKETEKLREDINALILSEGLVNGNIKIVASKGSTFVFLAAYRYPTEEAYLKGVNTGVILWERSDPNVKMVIDLYRKAVSDKLSSQGPLGSYFETLLVSADGFITEGSRSNVFFTDGGEVWTAPDDLVLKGITRKYVIDAIHAAGFKVNYERVKKKDIGDRFRGAFLSGTSLGVLPVAAVEDLRLGSSDDYMIASIRREYDSIVSRYLDSHS